MSKIVIYLFTIFFSIVFILISFWTFNRSAYLEQIKVSFVQQSALVDADFPLNTSGKSSILLKGIVQSDNAFNGISGKLVVFEKTKKEINKNKSITKWEDVKGSLYRKITPFKLKNTKGQELLVSPYGFEEAFVSLPEYKDTELPDGQILRESYWSIKPGDSVYVLGKLENNSGTLLISDPELSKSSLLGFKKEPFVISRLEVEQIVSKAENGRRSILLISLSLVLVGAFFMINSFANIVKIYRKERSF